MSSALKNSLINLVTSYVWWREQLWIISCEIILSFLAVWAFSQKINFNLIAFGFALSYLVTIISLKIIWRWGRTGALYLFTFGSIILLYGIYLNHIYNDIIYIWISLCITVGTLMSFKETQSIKTIAWFPFINKCKKKSTNNVSNMTAHTILMVILGPTCFYLSGVITQSFEHWPYIVACLAYFLLTPRLIFSLNKSEKRYHKKLDNIHWHEKETKEINTLLTFSTLISCSLWLGRRFIVPIILYSIIISNFGEEKSMRVYGLLFAILSVFMAAIKIFGAVNFKNKMFNREYTNNELFKIGIKFFLLGWSLICIATIFYQNELINDMILFILIILGWAITEFFSKAWNVLFFEKLFCSTKGDRKFCNRAHRKTIQRFFLRSNTGGFIAFTIGGSTGIVLGPWIFIGFIITALFYSKKIKNN